MPGMCSVPGCKGYKKARSRGVVFHSLPTRDPERCRKWLKAIHNPKFDENTPVSKYGNVRVCSQHFKPGDYEPDIQAELMKTTPRKILKSNVIPSVFSGRQEEDLSTFLPAGDRSRTESNAPSTTAQASTSVVSGPSVDSVLQWASVLTSISSGASSTSSLSPPPAQTSESLCSVASVDCLNESFHQRTESSSTAALKSDKNTEKDLSQSRTIVNDSCLMELFRKCQTCGQTITKKKVSHCGAQKKVRWSCLGGHRGIWMSSPHLWEAFPEIHLLTALAILFSGGTFTYFKKWAKHLHLNFMGNKTFFEIQKAYLNSERKQMIRTEQEGICAKGLHQQLEVTPLPISDPLKKIKAKSRGTEKLTLSSWSSYEKISSISMTSTGTCRPNALSSVARVSASERGKTSQQDDVEHQSETAPKATEVDRLQGSFEEMEVTIDEHECTSVKNRISDLDNDMENIRETTDLRAAGADDSCDERVYVPLIPNQRSATSELLLECEEEDLEPWQEQTSEVHLKDEDDTVELTDDQTDYKPSPLQRNAVNKTETPEPVVYNNQGFIVASPQLTSNTEFIGSVGTQCLPRNSFAIVPAGHQQLLQKVSTATVTPEAYAGVQSSEMQQISDNPVSLSSVQGPALYTTLSNQLQSDRSDSQALSVSISLPCFTILEFESTGTSNNQEI
ncbi:uncharacterized protein LOC130181666 [Seriola aureovittata]|uniref:uncharacterized protein LOC130181666 n=1 Tax=Seriola aureovittata TaxID=2871759 RepID=UPI0024BDE2BD|nr:uncharacterized protein LOC130181666 [Seriola aureovittata]